MKAKKIIQIWEKKRAGNSSCISFASLILLLVSAQPIVASHLNVCLEGGNVLAQEISNRAIGDVISVFTAPTQLGN